MKIKMITENILRAQNGTSNITIITDNELIIEIAFMPLIVLKENGRGIEENTFCSSNRY